MAVGHGRAAIELDEQSVAEKVVAVAAAKAGRLPRGHHSSQLVALEPHRAAAGAHRRQVAVGVVFGDDADGAVPSGGYLPGARQVVAEAEAALSDVHRLGAVVGGEQFFAAEGPHRDEPALIVVEAVSLALVGVRHRSNPALRVVVVVDRARRQREPLYAAVCVQQYPPLRACGGTERHGGAVRVVLEDVALSSAFGDDSAAPLVVERVRASRARFQNTPAAVVAHLQVGLIVRADGGGQAPLGVVLVPPEVAGDIADLLELAGASIGVAHRPAVVVGDGRDSARRVASQQKHPAPAVENRVELAVSVAENQLALAGLDACDAPWAAACHGLEHPHAAVGAQHGRFLAAGTMRVAAWRGVGRCGR